MKDTNTLVGGVIIKNRSVLLLQRSNQQSFRLFWEIPKGHVKESEELRDAICREVKEETKLDIIPIKFIGSFSYLADKGTRKSTQHNFLCHLIDENQQVILSKEHQDFKWVSSMGEVQLMVLPEVYKIISKVLNPDEELVNYPNRILSIEERINYYIEK